jgi:hypothetical protein
MRKLLKCEKTQRVKVTADDDALKSPTKDRTFRQRLKGNGQKNSVCFQTVSWRREFDPFIRQSFMDQQSVSSDHGKIVYRRASYIDKQPCKSLKVGDVHFNNCKCKFSPCAQWLRIRLRNRRSLVRIPPECRLV